MMRHFMTCGKKKTSKFSSSVDSFFFRRISLAAIKLITVFALIVIAQNEGKTQNVVYFVIGNEDCGCTWNNVIRSFTTGKIVL